jgi:hypothetical protein
MKLFRLLILALVTSLSVANNGRGASGGSASSATDVEVGLIVGVACTPGCTFNNGGLINLGRALEDAISDGLDYEVHEANSLRRSLEEAGADEFVSFSDEAELGHSRRLQTCSGFVVCFDLDGCCSENNSCPPDDSDARNLRGLNNGNSREANLRDAIDSAFTGNLASEIQIHGAHCSGGQTAVCSAEVVNLVFS